MWVDNLMVTEMIEMLQGTLQKYGVEDMPVRLVAGEPVEITWRPSVSVRQDEGGFFIALGRRQEQTLSIIEQYRLQPGELGGADLPNGGATDDELEIARVLAADGADDLESHVSDMGFEEEKGDDEEFSGEFDEDDEGGPAMATKRGGKVFTIGELIAHLQQVVTTLPNQGDTVVALEKHGVYFHIDGGYLEDDADDFVKGQAVDVVYCLTGPEN